MFVEQIEPRLLGIGGRNLGDQPETLVEAFARESRRAAGAEEDSELRFEVRLIRKDGTHGWSILRAAFTRQGRLWLVGWSTRGMKSHHLHRARLRLI
ncbi:hypothetical protein NSPZN2_100437 [Nitrospira defluvii]|uniref:Uncharacterized protein n=1 Tax=Nitrospira defluvii TaxID=330214 RepID=A0ABM8R4L6_9BACT|nr:hypothetical protein NSPZN2_100437 [Nitrospira defluvii]